MKNVFVFALLLGSALCAGIGGAWLFSKSEPQEVAAQANRPVKIAIVNLEEASRQSGWFKVRKQRWEEVQAELKLEREKTERTYREKTLEVQRAKLAKKSAEEIMPLEVEAQTYKELMEILKKQQEAYLVNLIAQYQNEVLRNVIAEIEQFTKLMGYDIVLQDYSVAETGVSDFMSGGAYAQSLINKPVLYTPGTETNKNIYVTDITKAIIQRVQTTVEPPKKPNE
ncbi:MAG: hypothetical protein KF696_09785 [Planctomycetes bacterium]|nr:hypothetical protein [Planctomycetota bacterium]MCW8136147.1 hypothetical protein [Planctomycetota bacterium]